MRGEKGLGLERKAENGLLAFLLLTGANGLTHFAGSLAAHGFEERLSEGQFRREGDGHLRPSNRLQRQPVAAHELEGQKERQQPEGSVHQGRMIEDGVGALSTEKPFEGVLRDKTPHRLFTPAKSRSRATHGVAVSRV